MWVMRAIDGSENAFCKLCKTTLVPKPSRLTKYEKKGYESTVKGGSGLQEMFSTQHQQEEKNQIKLAVVHS